MTLYPILASSAVTACQLNGMLWTQGTGPVTEMSPSLEPTTTLRSTTRSKVSSNPNRGSNHEPFTVIIQRHGDEIYRFACQLTGNRVDADDLYQETLLKAFRAFEKLPADANFRAWLYRICSNTFISDRRKHGRISPMNDAVADTLSVSPPDHARALDARDLLVEVERFVDDLPPKQRVALILRKHHEYGYAEIATILDSSEAAARANVHEALTKLRGAFAHRMEV
jgi:RNA polymerase sigma-70 factor (ECF subfamily)